MATTLADPAKMIASGAPRIIRSAKELAKYTEELEHLNSIARPTSAEIDAIELLTLLVTSYEDEHSPIPRAAPVEVLRFLMDQHGLVQRNLVPEFGTESAVSMFLSGHRRLNIDQVRRLSERFRVSADVFLVV